MLFFEEKTINRTKETAHNDNKCAGLFAEEVDFNTWKGCFAVFL